MAAVLRGAELPIGCLQSMWITAAPKGVPALVCDDSSAVWVIRTNEAGEDRGDDWAGVVRFRGGQPASLDSLPHTTRALALPKEAELRLECIATAPSAPHRAMAGCIAFGERGPLLICSHDRGTAPAFIRAMSMERWEIEAQWQTHRYAHVWATAWRLLARISGESVLIASHDAKAVEPTG